MTGDDRELLACLEGGPPPAAREALAALYARHGGVVLRFLRRLLGEANDAEDVLQDTCLTLTRRAGAFRGDDALPWLLAIAGNRARDLRRQGGRRVRRERAASRPETVAEEDAPVLDEALAALSERDRVVIELRHTQGLTHAQVAATLGVSVRTAKTWATRALEALRQHLEASD